MQKGACQILLHSASVNNNLGSPGSFNVAKYFTSLQADVGMKNVAVILCKGLHLHNKVEESDEIDENPGSTHLGFAPLPCLLPTY
jgi:hypothetical protein